MCDENRESQKGSREKIITRIFILDSVFSLKERGGKNLSGRPVYGKGDYQVNETTHNYAK